MSGTRNRAPPRSVLKPALHPLLAAMGVVGLACGACADSDARSGAATLPHGQRDDPASAFADHFDILSAVVLEERAGVLNVTPQIRMGGTGELLVADRAERQVRSYSLAGDLQWYLTHPTVSDPAVAVRVTDEIVLVADLDGAAGLVYGADTTRAPRPGPSVPLPAHMGTVDDLDLVADSLVVYSARPGEKKDPTDGLYLVEPQSGRLVRSFFRPYLSPTVADLARVAGWIKSSVRGDTIASLFAPCDTIFLHSIHGVALQRIPLPTKAFHMVDRPRQPGERLAEWTARLSFASDIFWLSNGDFLVLFSEFEHNLPRRHLLALTRGGELLFQIDDSPRLHAVLPGGAILFSSPAELATNQLVMARRR